MDEGMGFCQEIVRSTPPQRYTPWKLLRGVLGSTPISVLNYTTADMWATVRELLRRKTFDVLHVEGIVMSAYVSLAPPPIKVVHDWHNIESELMQRYATTDPSPMRRWYARQTANRLVALEEDLLRRDVHLVCSDREARELERRSPGARIHVVPNGVDAAYFADAAESDACGRYRLLFVGAMDYHANVEGALDFAKLWPEIHRVWPHLRWTLAGSNPVPAVRALADMPCVEVTGTVPDLRPYYATAVAAVVPLRTGSGTRLKILEALAAGVPIVSTALGAEGLAVKSGEHLLLAGTDADWLEALHRLVDHPAEGQRLAAAGRKLVLQTYDWSVIGASLRSIYEGLA